MRKEDRNIYISNVDLDEAINMYFSKLKFDSINFEEIDVYNSLDRVTVDPIFAKKSSPHYNSAAMDGIAVLSDSTMGASEVKPKTLELNKDFIYVNTGNVIDENYNAVIMIEDVMEMEDNKVQIISPAYPWQHIRPIGEDIVYGEMIIPSNHKIRPMDIGALICGGISKLKAIKSPIVSIIPTGNEIIENIDDIEKGKILDSNSRVFENLVIKYGGIPNRYSPQEDNYESLKNTIDNASKNSDLVVVNAGTSAGSKDYIVKVIREIGEVVVHGIALKPGKPTILGIVNNTPVLGIPGYPVSAYIVFEEIAKRLILKLNGLEKEEEEVYEAVLSKRLVSSLKHKEIVRVNLGYVGDKLVATPLTRGAGVTMSLVKADGLIEIPRNTEGIEAGNKVSVKLLKSMNHIKNSLVSIGSHDIVMDIIANKMNLSSGHVGSMGGIMAIKRGEAHIAPIHLLDTNTGEYNISYIQKYFKDEKMILIKGVKRLQGFIVQKGNPKNIKGFNDLSRKDVCYINRQRGAGTRLLLDYNLNKLDINSDDVIGYEREMNTHMAVAVTVKSESADTGLGVLSVAKAMDLDFIPVCYESYDFLVRESSLNDEKIKGFIQVLKSIEFKNEVQKLGGYGFDNIGKIIYI
ncbi:molybdopterin biosynthesis protein [Paraclostridium ghonii]|uniref:Molybdopterin molybdenumtransferase n=1 Tax=Paraclostridium ghonii TaxID=29358 RepID=A0ABU0N3L8_9FIRM|nr:molybdopterin biosynthesis protein [Paeniclostridium ghonii]MDQ0557757.1 putative molybdopterin biosynthesis protein [Paeniclostridium ghonii]